MLLRADVSEKERRHVEAYERPTWRTYMCARVCARVCVISEISTLFRVYAISLSIHTLYT